MRTPRRDAAGALDRECAALRAKRDARLRPVIEALRGAGIEGEGLSHALAASAGCGSLAPNVATRLAQRARH